MARLNCDVAIPPQSDRLLRCRETTLWAIFDVVAVQNYLDVQNGMLANTYMSLGPAGGPLSIPNSVRCRVAQSILQRKFAAGARTGAPGAVGCALGSRTTG